MRWVWAALKGVMLGLSFAALVVFGPAWWRCEDVFEGVPTWTLWASHCTEVRPVYGFVTSRGAGRLGFTSPEECVAALQRELAADPAARGACAAVGTMRVVTRTGQTILLPGESRRFDVPLSTRRDRT